ncbi:MAG: pilus assembly protein [Deltaproteobacteria bacterium]|nr:pilus assembly protein [Deltaproteobacteria bacterium]
MKDCGRGGGHSGSSPAVDTVGHGKPHEIMKRWKDSRGGAIVEFALVLPLFLVLLFGVLEFGLIIYYKGLITHASREGARRGATYSTPKHSNTDIQTWVQNYLTNQGIKAPFTVTASGAGGDTGTLLTVRVDLTYQFLVLPQLMGGLAPSPTLTAETVMRLE